MTLRLRLLIVTILGLAMTMTFWGWIQLHALEGILIEEQLKKLSDVAETVNTYYQHFPTREGLSTLDVALRDHVQSDSRLARIDIFSVSGSDVDYIAGAGQLPYEWPENLIESAAGKTGSFHTKLEIEGGPALGFVYTGGRTDTSGRNIVICVIVFSRANEEILSKAQHLLVFSTGGLLIIILVILVFSYRWLIDRRLTVIVDTIDQFQGGRYAQRIPLSRKDELGRVANHFNKMANEIEQVLERNKKLTCQLESRIQEETHKVVHLQQQVSQMQQLNALGYLTATLAHDLGTPLHSIAGLARLLLEKREDWPPDAARKLDLIVQQAQRLDTAIQKVRHATRLPQPHFENISVTELVNDTLSLVEPQLRRANIEYFLTMEEGVPLLQADRDRMQTALFNLIQNALEAMPDGGRLDIEVFTSAADHTLTISVKDNGAGIAPELMGRVCEPFFSTRPTEGIRGLGLAIVQDIVKTHRGKMEITSPPGNGSRIMLHFPLKESPGK